MHVRSFSLRRGARFTLIPLRNSLFAFLRMSGRGSQGKTSLRIWRRCGLVAWCVYFRGYLLGVLCLLDRYFLAAVVVFAPVARDILRALM